MKVGFYASFAALMLVGGIASAETPSVIDPSVAQAAGAHSPGAAPKASVAAPPAAPVDRNARLFQYISACMVERPGTGGSLDEALRRALTR